MVSEKDIQWLADEIKRYNRRPPWYDEPDPFDPVNPIFTTDNIVYLTYRAAKRRAIGTTRFDGQADLRKKVEDLDNAAPSYKEAVATKLSETITAELRHEVAAWADKPRKKRPRNVSTPSQSSDGVAISTTSTDDPPRIPSRDTTVTVPTGMMPPRCRALAVTATQDAQHESPCHSFERIPMSKAESILPDQLFGALDKLYSAEQETFSVRVGMEYGNTDDGTLSLAVSSDHIDRITTELFGIHLLRSKENRFYRIGNASIAPGLVHNCAVHSILGFFGEHLTEAIQASATYKLDRINKSTTTQAVALQISHDHINDPAILILRIGLYLFTNIWKILCPANLTPLEIPLSESIPPPGVGMPFALRPLDPHLVPWDGAQPTPCWIVGKNQHVYWRRCFLRVYTNSNNYFALGSCETCDGQCIVPEGKELFLGGKGGYVKAQE